MGNLFALNGFNITDGVKLAQQDIGCAYKDRGHQIDKGAIEDNSASMHGNAFRRHAISRGK